MKNDEKYENMSFFLKKNEFFVEILMQKWLSI